MELLNLFKEKGALLEGHFILSSGLHSDRYIQSALLLQYPDIAADLGDQIARKFPGAVDAVVSPAIGGLIIGHEVARAKKCRALFAEKDDDGNPVLRRGFNISSGEKILIIEDVITTGRSTNEVIKLVKGFEAEIIGIGSIVKRVKNPGLFGAITVHSLLTIDIESWDPKICNVCREGKIPAVKPGSRKK